MTTHTWRSGLVWSGKVSAKVFYDVLPFLLIDYAYKASAHSPPEALFTMTILE